jgi:hypothetical protein
LRLLRRNAADAQFDGVSRAESRIGSAEGARREERSKEAGRAEDREMGRSF